MTKDDQFEKFYTATIAPQITKLHLKKHEQAIKLLVHMAFLEGFTDGHEKGWENAIEALNKRLAENIS